MNIKVCDMPGCVVMCVASKPIESSYLRVYDWVNAGDTVPFCHNGEIPQAVRLHALDHAIRSCLKGLMYWESPRLFANAMEYLPHAYRTLVNWADDNVDLIRIKTEHRALGCPNELLNILHKDEVL